MQIDVKHLVAFIAIKMAMLMHVRAEARRPALQSHLPHQTAFDESCQAIINRGHRDLRQVAFGSNKNLLGRRVIAFLKQYLINVLALRSKPKSARGEPFIESAYRFFACK